MDNINNWSIEQFAAFLDGNLSEDALRNMAITIDNIPEYSEILKEVMLIDDSVDLIMSDQELLDHEISTIDFDVPIIADISDDTVFHIENDEMLEASDIQNTDQSNDPDDIGNGEELDPEINDDFDDTTETF